MTLEIVWCVARQQYVRVQGNCGTVAHGYNMALTVKLKVLPVFFKWNLFQQHNTESYNLVVNQLLNK